MTADWTIEGVVTRLGDLETGTRLIPVSPAMSAGEMVCAIRADAGSAVILLILDPAVVDPERAMMLAAIGPLAIELAPASRLAALDVSAIAPPESIAAAARFLAAATGTTGQVLRIDA